VKGNTSLKILYDKILKKNHEWYEHKQLHYKLKDAWCFNHETNEPADDTISVHKFPIINSFKNISGEIIYTIPELLFKANLY
jgi:hypothetical protein